MRFWKMILIGSAAGAVNGLFGAGGGMLLIPLLTLTAVLEEDALFPACVCIMLPICAHIMPVEFPSIMKKNRLSFRKLA